MRNEVIVIPAYEPSMVLVDLIKEIRTKVIVVDDGSGAEYKKIFNLIKDYATVISYSKNRGKGYALKKAFKYIKDNFNDTYNIVVMDSDGQHLVSDANKLFDFVADNKDSLCLGCRSVSLEMPFKSRFGNKITRDIFKLITGVYVSDTQTGLRGFNYKLLDKFINIEGDRFEYEINVLLECTKKKIPIKEMSIATIYHDRQNSCSHFNGFKDSIKIYKQMFKYRSK